MAKKRKCKCCGRVFEPKDKEDRFCSAVCRTTGLFVSGGGDTTKPGAAASKKDEPPKAVVPKVKAGDERFARVRAMFELPPSERYAISRTFTKEETEYARRMAKRQLAEDERIRREISWDLYEDAEGEMADDAGTVSEDSDDGTT